MTRRTNTDAIRELDVTVARLHTRVDHLELGVDRIDTGSTDLAKSVAADSKMNSEATAETLTRLAVIEQRFEDLKQTVERREQKRWGVVLIVVSALAGGVASVVLQKLLP